MNQNQTGGAADNETSEFIKSTNSDNEQSDKSSDSENDNGNDLNENFIPIGYESHINLIKYHPFDLSDKFKNRNNRANKTPFTK